MMESQQDKARRDNLENKGFEHRDISFRGYLSAIGIILAGLIVSMAIVWVVMDWQWRGLERWFPTRERAGPVGDAGELRPQLLVDDSQLRRQVARDTARLNGYGWVDRDQRIIHIPVERAMAVVVREGLPQWPLPAGIDLTTDTAYRRVQLERLREAAAKPGGAP